MSWRLGVTLRVPTCASCWETLPIQEFNLSYGRSSGHQSYCRRCSREKTRQSQRRLREDPEYSKAEVDRAMLRYRTHGDFRGRRLARAQAGHALERGEIQWSPCGCGCLDSEMHHEDYSKPLEVRWLCRPCHMLEHHGPDRLAVAAPLNVPVAGAADSIAELLRRFDERHGKGGA